MHSRTLVPNDFINKVASDHVRSFQHHEPRRAGAELGPSGSQNAANTGRMYPKSGQKGSGQLIKFVRA